MYVRETQPQITTKGSLLYSFKLSVGKVTFAGKNMYTNEAIASFLSADNVSLNFLYYSSMFIIENANINIYGAKIMNQELIRTAPIIFPPLNEQTLIANFLDSQCERIDSIISDIEKQIEILGEYKKSLITETVTKGLDKTVPMKDSGIEWIGQIPEHWEVGRIKDYYKITTGFTPDTTNSDYYDDENGCDWVSISDMQNDIKIISDTKSKITVCM